jgi:inosose dehydratase
VLGGKVEQWDALKELFVRRVGDWAKVAEQAKTVLAVKPHRFGAMNTPEQRAGLVKEIGSPWLKLAYDYSHFAGRDLPLADTLKALLPQTRFVHVGTYASRRARRSSCCRARGRRTTSPCSRD